MKKIILFNLAFFLCFWLSGCSVFSGRAPSGKVVTTSGSSIKGGGGYYKDDGPGDIIPEQLQLIPDAIPRVEPLHKGASRPYVVLGKQYVPQTRIQNFRQQGIASWYGKKFHGQKTSIGETYDMFAMTAAHPTLALPSYARVTNPANGKSVVVRVNDRGPFHAGRIMDLSYTAAYKLGYIENGSGLVIVESLLPGSPLFERLAAASSVSAPVSAAPEPDRAALDALALELQREEIQDAAAFASSSIKSRGIFLQLGAFSQSENAENLKKYLLRNLDWLSDPLFIYAADQLYRLQMGPYSDRFTAQSVAERIRDTLGYAPTFVTR
ncbi:MAG: septal ring lytic transglycosylase RlpA family protein [Zoogloeaceae bacterium]|jgi:rare lipoprotein A|nr:septal ring lytic transglycosylase RlpA family protein [Zoogloeaceae bacterium]